MRKRFKGEFRDSFLGDDLDVADPCFSSVFDPAPLCDDLDRPISKGLHVLDGCSRSSSDEDLDSPSSLSTTSEEEEADTKMSSLHFSHILSATPALDAMWNGAALQDESLPRMPPNLTDFSELEAPSIHEKPDIAKSLLLLAHGIDIDSLGAIEPHDPRPASASGTDKNVPPVQRAAHNAMERERRVNLRRCFDDLRTVVPRLRDAKAPSLQILKEAGLFIQTLREEEAELVAMKAALIQQNNAIRTQVSQLQGRLAAQQY
jgi:hypothetical protein